MLYTVHSVMANVNLRHLDLYTCLFSESETLVAFKKDLVTLLQTPILSKMVIHIYVPVPFLPVLVDAAMGFVK